MAPLALPQWHAPTNSIHEPLVSFTAVRGFAPWLARQNLPYEISPVPDQVFIWAQSQLPFLAFAAVPVPDAKQALAQFGQKLSANTAWQNHFIMPLTMMVTNSQISWTGLPPFVSPSVQAVHGASGDFLLAGLFPNAPGRRPLPPELFAQLATPDLVYYQWEITAERLKELPQLSQLGLMLTKHKQLDGNSAAAKWLEKTGPALGIAVTTARQTAPDELSFTRKAPGGLTAVELQSLANWLEATNFPGCDLSLPSRPIFKGRKQLPAAPAPAPFPLH